jgi:hypothetical protein
MRRVRSSFDRPRSPPCWLGAGSLASSGPDHLFPESHEGWTSMTWLPQQRAADRAACWVTGAVSAIQRRKLGDPSALTARRVGHARPRQHATPGRWRRPVVRTCRTADVPSDPVGATRVSPAAPSARQHPFVAGDIHGDAAPMSRKWPQGDMPAPWSAGQAAPDPYNAGLTPERGAHIPDRGCIAPQCRGDARRRPPRHQER